MSLMPSADPVVKDGTFTVTVAVTPLLLIEKNGDGSAATFYRFLALRATATFEHRKLMF